MKSLIVPMGGLIGENDNLIPYLFRLNSSGFMYCVEAIRGLDLDSFDAIYYAIPKEVNDRYFLSDMLLIQFKRMNILSKVSIVLLKSPTRNQAETVYRTIIQMNINGSIMIKDSDGYFQSTLSAENGIMIYPIDAMEVINPQNKSYVSIDDFYYVTNIIEKKIIGRWFAAGGYVFESSEEFCHYYKKLAAYSSLRISHVIYSMLVDNCIFRPVKVKFFDDWGTEREWAKGQI